MIKLFAIGNDILSDDGISIKVVKAIENNLKDKINIYYTYLADIHCVDFINNTDTIIIVDSTFFNLNPGTVTLLNKPDTISTINNTSISEIIRIYSDIDIYFIGIEVSTIFYSNTISNPLKEKFYSICCDVEKSIQYILRII